MLSEYHNKGLIRLIGDSNTWCSDSTLIYLIRFFAMKLLIEEEIISMRQAYSYIWFDHWTKKWWVYFLIQWDDSIWYCVSYVGKSSNLQKRIRSHYTKENVIFNWYSYINTPDDDNWFLEQMYISSMLPFYNLNLWHWFFFTKYKFIKEINKLWFIISQEQIRYIVKKFSVMVWKKTYIVWILALIYLWISKEEIMEVLWFIKK